MFVPLLVRHDGLTLPAGLSGCQHVGMPASKQETKTMDNADVEQLVLMQQLCDRVTEQTEALEPVVQAIARLNGDIQQLGAMYGQDWLRLHDALPAGSNGPAALLASIAPGRHSILGQDTIWNALHEARQVQLALVKRLVADL